MNLLAIVVAGVAGFGFGAVWYSILGARWAPVSGVPLDADGAPVNRSDPKPYVMGLVAMILVAAMMSHVFARSGIATLGEGLVSGLGLGLFVAAPWLVICYGFAARDWRLLLIDGGYAALGSAVIGAVLVLF